MSTILETVQDQPATIALLPQEQTQTLLVPVPPGLKHQGGVAAWLKFGLEYALALVMMVVAMPVILICALVVRLTSRGPAFYFQLRLGKNGAPFWIYKLRTMYDKCELRSGPQWSTKGDARITPLGKILRHTHLDELPQLFNILRGEMSLVGPRPERPEFVPTLAEVIPLYSMRLLVRPGVTGFAQVQLPADTNIESARLKLAYDLYYVRHGATLWMDLRILFATVFKIGGFSFALIRLGMGFPARQKVEDLYARAQHTAASSTH